MASKAWGAKPSNERTLTLYVDAMNAAYPWVPVKAIHERIQTVNQSPAAIQQRTCKPMRKRRSFV